MTIVPGPRAKVNVAPLRGTRAMQPVKVSCDCRKHNIDNILNHLSSEEDAQPQAEMG
jgi:hypothetical protein